MERAGDRHARRGGTDPAGATLRRSGRRGGRAVLDGGFDADAAVQTERPLVVLYAHDLEAMAAKVQAAGGAIVKPIFSFPGGRRFHFRDPSGNELAVWSES